MRNLFSHLPALIIGTVVGVGILCVKGCFTDTSVPMFTTPLADETLAQIAVEDHHIAIRTHTDTQAAYVPDAGSVVASVDTKGRVSLAVQNKGLTFKPVLGLMVTNQLRAVGGVQVAYWNRFELYLGGGYPKPVAFAGLGFRLDQIRFLQNTSVVVTYTTAKELGLAALVRF